MEKLKPLNFHHNWNGKLRESTYFTTIRAFWEGAFIAGEQRNVMLNGKFLYPAEVVDIKLVPFAKISDWMLGVDTGYLGDEGRNIFYKMHAKKGLAPETAESFMMNVVLMKRLDPKPTKAEIEELFKELEKAIYRLVFNYEWHQVGGDREASLDKAKASVNNAVADIKAVFL